MGRVLGRVLGDGAAVQSQPSDDWLEGTAEVLLEAELAELLSVMIGEAPDHIRNSDQFPKALIAIVQLWQMESLGPGQEQALRPGPPQAASARWSTDAAARKSAPEARSSPRVTTRATPWEEARSLLASLRQALPGGWEAWRAIRPRSLRAAAIVLGDRWQGFWTSIRQGSRKWLAEPTDLDQLEADEAIARTGASDTDVAEIPPLFRGHVEKGEAEALFRAQATADPRIPRGQVPALAAALEDVGSADDGFGFLVLYGAYAPQERKGCEFRVAGMGLAQLSRGLAKWFNQAGRPDFPLQVIDDGAGELKVLISLNGSRAGQ